MADIIKFHSTFNVSSLFLLVFSLFSEGNTNFNALKFSFLMSVFTKRLLPQATSQSVPVNLSFAQKRSVISAQFPSKFRHCSLENRLRRPLLTLLILSTSRDVVLLNQLSFIRAAISLLTKVPIVQ